MFTTAAAALASAVLRWEYRKPFVCPTADKV